MLSEKELELEKMVRAVLRHRGGWYEFVPSLQKLGQKLFYEGKPGLNAFAQYAIRIISEEKNLYAAMTHLWNHGGSAPGPDGVSLSRLENKSERFQFARAIRDEIRRGEYVIGAYSVLKIKKASGNGVRKIAVQNLADKIVQRAAAQVLGAILDPYFSSGSYGYRPKRNRQMALADVEHLAVTDRMPVWVCDDLVDAFDNVPLTTVIELVSSYFPDEKLIQLIRELVRMGERSRGLLQGSPLSPVLLNLFAHHKIDTPLAKRCPVVRMFRWSDDILLICRNRKEARWARVCLQNIVRQATMSLKGGAKAPIADLRKGERITWLGYNCGVTKERNFDVQLDQRAICSIKEKLLEVAPDENLIKVVCVKIQGWLEEAAPAFDPRYARKVLREILGIVKELGLARKTLKLRDGGELRVGIQREWLAEWQDAHERWFDRYVRHREGRL